MRTYQNYVYYMKFPYLDSSKFKFNFNFTSTLDNEVGLYWEDLLDIDQEKDLNSC